MMSRGHVINNALTIPSRGRRPDQNDPDQPVEKESSSSDGCRFIPVYTTPDSSGVDIAKLLMST